MSSLTQDRSHFLGPHDFRTVESDPFSPLHTIFVCYQVSPPRRPRCSRVHPSHHLCFPPPSLPFFSFPFLIALFYSAVTIRKSIPVNPRQPRQRREGDGRWDCVRLGLGWLPPPLVLPSPPSFCTTTPVRNPILVSAVGKTPLLHYRPRLRVGSPPQDRRARGLRRCASLLRGAGECGSQNKASASPSFAVLLESTDCVRRTFDDILGFYARRLMGVLHLVSSRAFHALPPTLAGTAMHHSKSQNCSSANMGASKIGYKCPVTRECYPSEWTEMEQGRERVHPPRGG